MSDAKRNKPRGVGARQPGPARLFALAAGGGLALLGVLGFFYDASFGTGNELTSDDLAGILFVNGWRNIVYLGSGLLALAFAPRLPRATALALGLLYLALAIWGFDVTDRGIGSILDTLPLGNNDNALHLVIGILGLGAVILDGALPSLPKRRRPREAGLRGKRSLRTAEDGRAARRRPLSAPRRDGGAGPR